MVDPDEAVEPTAQAFKDAVRRLLNTPPQHKPKRAQSESAKPRKPRGKPAEAD